MFRKLRVLLCFAVIDPAMRMVCLCLCMSVVLSVVHKSFVCGRVRSRLRNCDLRVVDRRRWDSFPKR